MGQETYKISQLPEKTSADSTDLMEVSVSNGTSYDSKKISVGQIAETAMNEINYDDLNTTAKTIIGAINELLNSTPSGGGMELDGSTSTWWDNSALVPITVQGKVLAVNSEYTQNAIDYQVQIVAKQTGTNPSPQNICQITGFTGANIGHSNELITIDDGEIVISYSQSGSGDPSPSNICPITPGLSLQMDDSTTLEIYGAKLNPVTGSLTVDRGIYTFTGNEGNYAQQTGRVAIKTNLTMKSGSAVCDHFANVVSGATNWLYITTTMIAEDLKTYMQNNTVNAVYLLATPITYNLSQTELARALTALETTVYPVSWQSVAGTVYGGTDKVTQGELSVSKMAFTFDASEDENWQLTGTGTNRVFRLNNAFSNSIIRARDNTYICNMAILTRQIFDIENLGASYWFFRTTDSTNNYDLLVGTSTDDVNMTLEEFKTMLASTPMVIVADLRTPITYSLTPETITLTEGNNTIWADTGDSTLTYRGVQSQTLLGFNMLNSNLGSEEQTEENTEELDNTEVMDNVSE